MDYDTTEQASVKNPALPILNLKDAIYKFDSQVTLRSEPRILEGGFCNWILHYPTMVTNSSWTWERRKEEPVDSWLNEDLDYPELPGEGKGKKEEEKTKMDNVEVKSCVVLQGWISQYIRLLYWRDGSHNTLDYCIGGMHLTIH